MIDEEFMNEEIPGHLQVFKGEPSEIEIEKMEEYMITNFTYINKDEI